MMETQPPPADVMADLGQWLQQWTAFIQTQIEAQDELPPLRDESGEMAVEATAVPHEASSPPAHWLALFEEQGLRSLEEAAAASSETSAIHKAVVTPIDFEPGQVDTAVLAEWISQMHDGILAFREQIAPQTEMEQAENAFEMSALETAVLDMVDTDLVGADEAEMPRVETRSVSKSSAKQAAPKPESVEKARTERERPFPTSTSTPPASSVHADTLTGRSVGIASSEVIPVSPIPANPQVIQRKEKPPGETLAIKNELSPMPPPPSTPTLPDASSKDGRTTPPSIQQPQSHRQPSPPAPKTDADWPALPLTTPASPPSFPAHIAAVPSSPPRTIKRVTRLRLNPQPQSAPPPIQAATLSSQNPVETAVSNNNNRPEVTVTQPVTAHYAETAVSPPNSLNHTAQPERTGSHMKTAVFPVTDASAEVSGVESDFVATRKLNREVSVVQLEAASPQPTLDYVGIRPETAVSPPNAPDSAAAAHAPSASLKSKTSGRNPINLTLPVPAQPVAASPQLLAQPPLSPAAKSGSGAVVREEERPLPPHPITHSTTKPQPERQVASLKPEQPLTTQNNQLVPPPKQPDYHIPPPPPPRQSPNWSVTPENRWPTLPSLPKPDPNPAPSWRHQPTRRQRLDREQLGVSWNESYS